MCTMYEIMDSKKAGRKDINNDLHANLKEHAQSLSIRASVGRTGHNNKPIRYGGEGRWTAVARNSSGSTQPERSRAENGIMALCLSRRHITQHQGRRDMLLSHSLHASRAQSTRKRLGL